jgi:hypothetical protein
MDMSVSGVLRSDHFESAVDWATSRLMGVRRSRVSLQPPATGAGGALRSFRRAMCAGRQDSGDILLRVGKVDWQTEEFNGTALASALQSRVMRPRLGIL